jgi:site-specific recombinase XerD
MIVFKSILSKAFLHDILFHNVRHTFATLSLQVGIQPNVVADIIGHASVKIILDTYSHVTNNMYYDDADKIASIIGT